MQGEIEAKLPKEAKALSAPVAAATRQIALSVSQKALAAPRVQDLVSLAIRRSHGQFVRLIEDKNEYVATTGGAVTLEYGDLVADLATRLGVDPATIAKLQSVVQEVSTGPQAALDHDSDADQVGARRPRPGGGGHAEPAAGTGSRDAPDELRRAAGEDREPRQDDRERSGEGPGPAPGQSRQARQSAIGARRSADRSRRPHRRGAQGSRTGERRWVGRRARFDPGSGHRAARPPGAPEPRRARRAEVRSTRRGPETRRGAPQPRLRAAAARALPLRGCDLPGEGVAPAKR